MSAIVNWADAVAAYEAWAGDAAGGEAIVMALRTLDSPKGTLEGTAAELRKLMKDAKTPKPVTVETLRTKTRDARDGSGLRSLALFAHAATAGDPWDVPSACARDLLRLADANLPGDPSEDEGIAAAFALAAYAAHVCAVGGERGARARAWLWRGFAFRSRDVWLPHAVALARVFEDDADMAKLPPDPRGVKKGAARDARHRHGLTLRVLLALRRGSFGGSDAAAWADQEGGDFSDATAVLTGLVAFARAESGPLAEAARDLAEARIAALAARDGVETSYFVWDSARAIVRARGAAAAPTTLAALFDAPRDFERIRAQHQAAHLFDAGLTLKWLEALDSTHPRDLWRARILAGRLRGAERIVEAVHESHSDWSARIGGALGRLSEGAWESETPREKALALVEALWLAVDSRAAQLDWARVVHGAGAGWLEPSRASVARAAWTDLMALAAQRYDGSVDLQFEYLRHRVDIASAPKQEGKRQEKSGARSWTTDLERITHARWTRSSDGAWRGSAALTNNLTDRVHRRLLLGEEEPMRLLLRVLAFDQPPCDARLLLSEGAVNEQVESIWVSLRDEFKHDADRDASLERAIDALVACDAVAQPDLRTWADAWQAAFEAFCALDERFVAVASTTGVALDAARAALQGAPRRDAESDPGQVRAYVKGELQALVRALRSASDAMRAAVATEPEGTTSIDPRVKDPLAKLSSEDAPDVHEPLVDDEEHATWLELFAWLGDLARPLPIHVEVVVDNLVVTLADWLAVAHANHHHREEHLRTLREAIREEREDDVRQVVKEQHALLGEASVREAAGFWLRRLEFEEVRALRSLRTRGGAQPYASVQTPLAYFSPLLFGIAGAPLQSIQTDKIWTPILHAVAENPLSPAFHCTVWPLFALCVGMLWFDVRRDARTVPRAAFVRRGAAPLAAVLAVNLVANAAVYLVAPQGQENNPAGPVATVLLWSSLSLFMGVFIGLVAQGRRAGGS